MTRQSTFFNFMAFILLTASPAWLLSQNPSIESGNHDTVILDKAEKQHQDLSSAPLPIKGIFVTGSQGNIFKKGRPDISGIQFYGVEIPGGSAGLKEILQSHMGKLSNKEELKEIIKDISAYYHTNKLPAVTVKAFPKTPNGVVQILISNKPKKTVPILGVFVTGSKDNIVKQGRSDISDVLIVDLNTISPEAGKELKAVILHFINKKMVKETLADLQKQIVQFYRDQHLPPITVKVIPKQKTGIVQILISPREKKPLKIRGIFLTGKDENILVKGRKGIKDVQVSDLDIPGGSERLMAALLPFIGKSISKDELRALQKEIIQYYHTNKLPPIAVKISPKKTGGVIQILITKTKKKVAKKGSAKEAKKKDAKGDKKKDAKKAPKPPKPVVIKGIFVTSNPKEILKEGRKLEGIQAQQLFVPFSPEMFQCYLSPFIGKLTTPKELKELKKRMIRYFHRSGSNFNLHVELNIKDGVIQALIVEKRIGKITYTGTKWMSEDQIAHIFNEHEGDLIDKDRIRNNFAWLNQNAFHKSKIHFTPSKINKGDVDIKLTTKDAFPLRFTLSGDNTGTPSIGRERIGAGVTWGNAFWQDDILSYNYSTSNIFRRYYSHTGNYLTYLPWKHKFSIFGNYSKSRPGIPDVRSISNSNQCRVRYTIPFLPLYTRFLHSIAFGFDVKYGRSYSLNLVRPNAVARISKLQIAQFVGNYTLYNVTKKHNITMILNLYWSPGRFFENQSKAQFQAKRNFARADYAYLNLVFTDIYQLPAKWSLAGSLTVQKANKTLPPTELFSIGGYNTVRGYRPSEYNSDNGLIANLELRTPTMKPLKHFYKKVDDSLFFLGFVDYGIGYNFNHSRTNPRMPLDRRSQWALGAGFGLRYQIQQYLSFRCDYGFKCHHMHYLDKAEKRARNGKGELHVGLLLSY